MSCCNWWLSAAELRTRTVSLALHLSCKKKREECLDQSSLVNVNNDNNNIDGKTCFLVLAAVCCVLYRLFYGFGLGLSLRCGPMYLREIVPPSARDSAMVSIKLSMVIGMVLSYIVGNLIDVKLYGEPGPVSLVL